MKLVIGGYAQGKLEFALQRYKEEKWAVFDGRLPSEKQLQELCKQKKKVIIYHFHKLFSFSISSTCYTFIYI